MFEVEKNLEPDITLVCKLDKEGKIKFINKAYTDITGFSEKDLIGESHEIIQHPKMPQVVLNSAWKNINNGEHYYLISKNITKNGEYFWTVADITSRVNENKSNGIYIRRKYLPSNIKQEISKLYDILFGIENSGNGIEIAEKYLKGWLEERGYNKLEDYIIAQFNGEKKLREYITTEVSDKELLSTDPNEMDIDDILKFVKKKKRKFWF